LRAWLGSPRRWPPEIAMLEPDHPRRRLVPLMSVYSAELDSVTLAAFGYRDVDAER
jgi:hypothetical protein